MPELPKVDTIHRVIMRIQFPDEMVWQRQIAGPFLLETAERIAKEHQENPEMHEAARVLGGGIDFYVREARIEDADRLTVALRDAGAPRSE